MTGLSPTQSAKLVAKGRMKSIGVSWTEEEAVAISKCAPAEREALIAKLRGETAQPEAKVDTKPEAEKAPEVPAPAKVKKPRVKK